MATAEERSTLLSKPCRWCGARTGEQCRAATARVKGNDGAAPREVPVPVTTLDGGFHDLRWQDTLGRPARVVTTAVPVVEDPEVESPTKVLESAGERPW